MSFFSYLLILSILFKNSTFANDTAPAVGAGGIDFHKPEEIMKEKEDLFISPDLIKILYVFKNLSDHDINVDIFFSVPIQNEISAQKTWDQEILKEMNEQNLRNNPEHDTSYLFENLPFENFTVKVNGQTIVFKTEIRALKNGTDITPIFKKNNLPLSPVLATCNYPIQMEKDQDDCHLRMQQYKSLGLLSSDGKVLWQKQIHYHWRQNFPKNKAVAIEQSYRPASGSFFLESHPNYPAMESLMEQILVHGGLLAQFCPWQSLPIKENFIPWLLHRFQNKSKSTETEEQTMIKFYEVDYRDSGSKCKGPIRDFILTVEYPKEGIVAACWPFDVQKIKDLGNNQLQFHQKNFNPDQDLKILFGTQLRGSK